tara:strand:+ start:138 stop:311 length:174 start_codon:yes stop_codon:yes gene_type:complete
MISVGTRVRHPKFGIGTVLELRKYGGMMVDFSSKGGVLVRVVHKASLEVVDGKKEEN